ncbi:MAG: hypothetical protein RR311_17195 [Comamonas sp.]
MLHAHAVEQHPLGHSGAGPGSQIAVYAQAGAVCALWTAESMHIDPTREAFKILADVKSETVPGAA